MHESEAPNALRLMETRLDELAKQISKLSAQLTVVAQAKVRAATASGAAFDSTAQPPLHEERERNHGESTTGGGGSDTVTLDTAPSGSLHHSDSWLTAQLRQQQPDALSISHDSHLLDASRAVQLHRVPLSVVNPRKQTRMTQPEIEVADALNPRRAVQQQQQQQARPQSNRLDAPQRTQQHGADDGDDPELVALVRSIEHGNFAARAAAAAERDASFDLQLSRQSQHDEPERDSFSHAPHSVLERYDARPAAPAAAPAAAQHELARRRKSSSKKARNSHSKPKKRSSKK
jgi:hypothetical protein